ncbi:MAG: SDR family oxidoreductase [Rhizobiales bacterium]|nr:SDR family oxidoreductase [Hyphomicrobiales bacterium]
MGRLTGKSAFVTSAGAGIGRASALAMAQEGATVTATDIDEAALATLDAASDNITTFKLDALDPDAIQAAAERVGAPDILFNCSGFVHHGTVLDATDDDFDFSFNLNVKAHFRVIKAFLPAMLDNGGGSIINMASVAGSIKGAPNRAIYGATKGAVIGLTKAVAADHVTQGIRCNCICPGTVETPSLDERIKAQGDYDKARKAFIERQPMGRLASAEEIAALVVYLASDESLFTTGTTQIIDGGWSL